MIDNRATISAYIKDQLPEFITLNHLNFQSFIEAYYEWMETSNNPYLTPYKTLTYRNVDKTVPVFLEQIQNEVMQLFPKKLHKNINKKRLIKNIKGFYETKGTEKSIRFIFRVLFGKEIDISYPGDLMLVPSDGKWIEKKSLKITNKNSKIDELNGTTIWQKKPIVEVPNISARPLNKTEKIFAEAGFDCVINIYGIKLFCSSLEMGKYQEEWHTRVASLLAQLLDNNGDGLPDNQKLVDTMTANNVVILVTRNSPELTFTYGGNTSTYYRGSPPHRSLYEPFKLTDNELNTDYDVHWIQCTPNYWTDMFTGSVDIIDIRQEFSDIFTENAPMWEYLMGKLLSIILVSGLSRMDDAFSLINQQGTDISMIGAYNQANANTDSTSSCLSYEGLEMRQFVLENGTGAEWPPENDSYNDELVYYFTTGMMLKMGFYGLMPISSGTVYNSNPTDTDPTDTTVTPEEPHTPNTKFNQIQYAGRPWHEDNGGDFAISISFNDYEGDWQDQATDEIYGNCWLLDHSWGGDFCHPEDVDNCNNIFTQLIDKFNLPTLFPTGWYRPAKDNNNPTLPTRINAKARIINTSKYKVPPIHGNEIFIESIVGEFDGNYPIRFTIDETDYEEDLYLMFSGIGFTNKGKRFAEDDVMKISPRPEIVDSSYINEKGEAPLGPVNITHQGIGGIAIVSKVDTATGKIDKVRISNFGIDYKSWKHNIEFNTTNGVLALGTILSDWVCEYDGYWSNDDGKLSSIKLIRDNERYHEYSYVIESDMTLDAFHENILRLTHPAGTAVFGDVKISGKGKISQTTEAVVVTEEIPLIGNYGPYTFQTENNLRNLYELGDRVYEVNTDMTDDLPTNLVDLYPNGFDPTAGTVAEDGSTSHVPGTPGPLDNNVENIFFSNVPAVADAEYINTYWVVYPHPYSRLLDVQEKSIMDMSVANFITSTIDTNFYDQRGELRVDLGECDDCTEATEVETESGGGGS